MKVKEYPPSLWRTLQLKSLPAKKIKGGLSENVAKDVVISFTSIASRLKYAHLAVRSILSQTVTPEGIVLWLGKDCEPEIPEQLLKLTGGIFSIRFCEDVGPHTKLIYSLSEFPDRRIVTCDDDLMYPRDWLENLLKAAEEFPNDIIGNQCRLITAAADGELWPYKKWPYEQPGASHANTLPLGYAGVIYPPKSLPESTLSRELFKQLSPKADDLWFKAMSAVNGTKSRRSSYQTSKPLPIPFSQAVSLKKTNVREDGNREQWSKLAEHFELSLDRA
ncbi:glycosyltransferase [Marinobacter sp. SBS5]|uniref:glycosyltransferase n=1 Tax=Marinobacter sp. SBS5 TaxID=3401754 RepID=UPI003AAA53F3